MDPLNAPLPTASYLPFHPDEGSQTSILMSESRVGFSVASTRQNDGSQSAGRADAPASGGVKAPAPTASARVIVACGTDNVESPPHDPAAVAARSGATTG